jgi:hypothetical protein
MFLISKRIIGGLVFLAAGIALALMADAWRSARQDSQQLAATLASQKTAIEQAGEREKLRDSQLANALAAIEAKKRSVQTPQQAAAQLDSALPPLPLPVSVQSPNLSPLTPPDEAPPTILSIPQPDLIPLYDALQTCRACTVQNDSLQKDLADEKLRSTALQHERDAAISDARGGRWLTRLKRSAKWFAIGLAAGAIAATVARR